MSVYMDFSAEVLLRQKILDEAVRRFPSLLNDAREYKNRYKNFGFVCLILIAEKYGAICAEFNRLMREPLSTRDRFEQEC